MNKEINYNCIEYTYKCEQADEPDYYYCTCCCSTQVLNSSSCDTCGMYDTLQEDYF